MVRFLRPARVGIVSVVLALSSVSIPVTAQAAPTTTQSAPAATPSGFYVLVDGGTLVVQALGPTSDFGPDETLRIERSFGSTTVTMVGDDATSRLVAADTLCGTATAMVKTVTCRTSVADAYVDYSRLSSYTQTYVDGDLPVTFVGGSGEDYFQAGSGADTLDGGGGPDVLFGDPEEGPYGDDTITGGTGKDIIDALGGTNRVFAKDGEADTRVQCADIAIPGSSGQAIWDVDLDKPISCDELVEVPKQPRNFSGGFSDWCCGPYPTSQLRLTWERPSDSDPVVTSYEITIKYADKVKQTATVDGALEEYTHLVSEFDWTPGAYTFEIVAKNAAGSSPVATASAELPFPVPTIDQATATVLLDARQGVKVSWSDPTASSSLAVTGFDIQRKVEEGWRSGEEWLTLARKSASSTFLVDVCLPPKVKVSYRVRAVYVDRATGKKEMTSAWTETSWVTTAQPQNALPAAPTMSVDFNGLALVESDEERGLVTVRASGEGIDPGLCFGVGLSLWTLLKADVYSLVPIADEGRTMSLPRGVGRFTRGLQILSEEIGRIPKQIYTVGGYQVWILDKQWRDEYGRGFDLTKAENFQFAPRVNWFAPEDLIKPTNVVYASNPAPKVSSINATIDEDGIVSAKWTAPDGSANQTLNWRDKYEVCISAPGVLAKSPVYPTTNYIRCSLVGKSVTALKFGPEYYCPWGWNPTQPMTCAGYPIRVGVRPWVGDATVSMANYLTLWIDWNASAFRFVDVTSTASPTVRSLSRRSDAATTGDCLASFDPLESIATTVVPCGGTHQAEVFGQGTLPDDLGLPSQAVVVPQNVSDWCVGVDDGSAPSRMLSYLGLAGANIPTRLAMGVVLPTDEEWLAGDRTVGCAMGVVDIPAQGAPTATSWSGAAPAKVASQGPQWLLSCSAIRPVSGATASLAGCAVGGWLLVDQGVEVTGTATSPYPGAALQAAADDACQPVAGAWSGDAEIPSAQYAAVLPPEAFWQSGVNSASCWIALSSWSGQVTLTPESVVPADAVIAIDGPATAYAEVGTRYEVHLTAADGSALVYVPVTVDVAGDATISGGGAVTAVTTDADGMAEVYVRPGKTGTFTVSASAVSRPEVTSAIEVSIEAAPQPTPQVTIKGKKGKVNKKKGVIVTGTTLYIAAGAKATPYFKVKGKSKFTKAATIKVAANGTFTWKKATAKPITVYVRVGQTKSNTITVKP